MTYRPCAGCDSITDSCRAVQCPAFSPVPAGAGGVDREALTWRVSDDRRWVLVERDGVLVAKFVDDDAADAYCNSLAALAAAEQRADTLAAENERLQRRLWPDQGHGYANEVERQRAVIDTLRAALSSRVPVQPEETGQ